MGGNRQHQSLLVLFDSQDQMVMKFGSKGNGNGEFNMPMEVAFDDDNYLYAVDNNNCRVQKLLANMCFSLVAMDQIMVNLKTLWVSQSIIIEYMLLIS